MMSDTQTCSQGASCGNGITNFRGFIAELGKRLPCGFIMTPWKEVQTVQGTDSREVREQATDLMNARQYSCVPLANNDTVEGLYLRHNPEDEAQYQAVESNHFCRLDLDVISLLKHMRDERRIALLVGEAECPRGLVTYADFSKRPARVLLFAVVAEVESLLARAIDEVYPNDSWIELVEPYKDAAPGQHVHPREELRDRKESAVQWDAVMPLTTFAEIRHMINVVKHSETVRGRLGEDNRVIDELKSLPDLRNRVAHAVRPVIAGPKRIKGAATQVELMLKWIDRWEKRLASDQREGAV